MNLYRIRFRAADSPGRLGAAASALGALGVNILSVDVQSVDGDEIVDDLVVELTVPIDLPAIEVALRGSRPWCSTSSRSTSTICAIRSPNASTSSTTWPEGPDLGALADAARSLVRADLAVVIGPSAVTGPLGGIVEAARSSNMAVLDVGFVQQLGGQEPVHLVALPFDSALVGRVLLLARRRPAFSATEVARVASLLRFSPVFAGDQRVRWAHGAA
ncbi:MAG: ACT domain-containing protein [Ilumatobacteraceae bacterium]